MTPRQRLPVTGTRLVSPSGGAPGRARRALAAALLATRSHAAVDANGYVTALEDNLLPGIDCVEVRESFGAGAGHELDGKMRAPWSSSALVVNAFTPWKDDPDHLSLTGISGFTGPLVFEAKCPNGVSSIPPHLDVLLEQGDVVIAVESKCTEFLSAKTAKVAEAYRRLADTRDARTDSRWFKSLAYVSEFRHVDTYQLVKHYLGLARTYSDQPLILVYLYWEPTNGEAFVEVRRHREEIGRLEELVADDERCRLKTLSYGEHWRELDALPSKPDWLDRHLAELRARYEIAI